MIGKTLSHYQVIEKLGEGGMGVVYKARDTHLDRFVAVKVLPAEKVADPDRKRRFVQEAKAASALNHPSIIHVYDIDQADGTDFIVMEYVPGKTLDELIPRKGLRLSVALKYAIQMADALARAHGAGIIHRDLKPSNVMVDEHGLVKVLDFGLAKLTETGPVGDDASTRTAEATTEKGTIVGTVTYMSPEQAEGKQVDPRSDIFSFGSMLYEMLTGQRAFRGDTKASTIAAILKEEPKSISELAEGLPHEAERILKRCLRKDPAHRFQHIEDLRVALEELKEESESGGFETAPVPKRKRGWVWAGSAAILFIALVAAGLYLTRQKPAVQQEQTAMKRLTSDSGLNTEPMLSPDGSRVAYASDREGEGNLDIWIQQVATGNRLRLTKNEADEYEPAFSPDSNLVAYRSEQEGGGIYVVSALGGEPIRIVRGGRRPRFSPDGKWIAYWAGGWGQGPRLEGGLFVIPSQGGQPKAVQPNFKRAGLPEWLPDGRHLLFRADQGGATFGTEDVDVWITNLDDENTPAVRTGLKAVLAKQNLNSWSLPQWITSDSKAYLLFSAPSGDAVNIWRVQVDPEKFQATGPAEQLTFGAANQTSVHAVPVPGCLRMVFTSLRSNTDIWSLPLDANRAVLKGPLQRITDQESPESHPDISEDGRRLVFAAYRLGDGKIPNIWIKDLIKSQETLLNPARSHIPNISRDGRRIMYKKYPAGEKGFEVYMVAGGDPVLVCDDCFTPTGVSRDGTMLLDEARPPSLRVVLTAERKGVTILKHPTWGVYAGRLSPDERWIAFHVSPQVDARRIYIAPFRGPTPIDLKEWIPVTDGLGMERYGTWAPDGNTLYFLSEHDGFRCIRSQRLNPASKRPEGPPLDVFHSHHARLSMMNLVDPIAMGFRIAIDKAVFAIEERTGNIWMTEIPAASP